MMIFVASCYLTFFPVSGGLQGRDTVRPVLKGYLDQPLCNPTTRTNIDTPIIGLYSYLQKTDVPQNQIQYQEHRFERNVISYKLGMVTLLHKAACCRSCIGKNHNIMVIQETICFMAKRAAP